MSGRGQMTIEGRPIMGDGSYPYNATAGVGHLDCPCPECLALAETEVITCKVPEDFAADYPPPTWTTAEPSDMCVRLLMWTDCYYDHSTTTLRKRSDNIAITALGYDHCWRMASWCGTPDPLTGRTEYNRPACPPTARPWSCACWDYSDCTAGDLLPISLDSFEYVDVGWQSQGCSPVSSNPLIDPIFAEIVSQLGADKDGFSVVIHILVSTTKWSVSRTDIRQHEYPEVHGYTAVPSCLVFPPNSPEACEWEGYEATYDTNCP